MTSQTKRGAKPHPKPKDLLAQAIDLQAELNAAGIPQRDESRRELTLVERVRLIQGMGVSLDGVEGFDNWRGGYK